MANNVTVKTLGGQSQVLENFEGDIKALKAKLSIPDNYSATINGSPAQDSQAVGSYAFVIFAPQVKGA